MADSHIPQGEHRRDVPQQDIIACPIVMQYGANVLLQHSNNQKSFSPAGGEERVTVLF